MMEKRKLQYMVGGLLYMPAFQHNIVDKLVEGSIEALTSLAFCLEDAIADDSLQEAEASLRSILEDIDKRVLLEKRPLIFVRVRTPEHLHRLAREFRDLQGMVTGILLPKFDTTNAAGYAHTIREINHDREKPLYILPILESARVCDLRTRKEELTRIREILDVVRDYVLNIRVGGNDFSNLYGLRRLAHLSIYDVGVVRDALLDILNVFAMDYVVSGPVWDYAGTEPGAWSAGLQRELELDRVNGFIGKTAIHPSQLPYIFDSLKVTRPDYEDACLLLDWRVGKLGVCKSADGSRMNEVKCHRRWAERISVLAEIYGIKEEQ